MKGTVRVTGLVVTLGLLLTSIVSAEEVEEYTLYLLDGETVVYETSDPADIYATCQLILDDPGEAALHDAAEKIQANLVEWGLYSGALLNERRATPMVPVPSASWSCIKDCFRYTGSAQQECLVNCK